MNRLLNVLFSLRHNYTDPVERQRARALLTMAWLGLAIWLVSYLAVIVPNVLQKNVSSSGWFFISLSLLPVALVVSITFVQFGRERLASTLFVAAAIATCVPIGLIAYADILQFLSVVPLVAAGVLLGRRGLLVTAAIVAVGLALSVNYQSTVTVFERFLPAESAIADGTAIGAIFMFVTAFLYAFNGSPERIARDASAINTQWQAVSQLTVRGAVDEPSAVEPVLRQAQTSFGFSLAQALLLTDRPGIMRRYRLTENGALTADAQADLVTQDVLSQREPVIVRLGDRRANEHLVNPAQVSISLPIQFEGTLLGILNLQSPNRLPVDGQYLALYEALASQIGRALAQHRRINALEKDVAEQEDSARRLRAQIADLQRRAEGTTVSGWERYLRGFGVAGFGYDLDISQGRALIQATDLPPQVRQALELGEVHVEVQGNTQVVSAPIAYRNQMLGAMVFSVPEANAIGSAEVELISTIANRLGNALENNRLFEQNQAQALRERKASDVGGLLLSATEVEQILSLAAETFNEALGATHTRISLQADALQPEGASTQAGTGKAGR